MKWSEYKDLNLGPPAPKAGALTRLRYTPKKTGAPTTIRTQDLLITNQLLYQLSYRGKMVDVVGIEPTVV